MTGEEPVVLEEVHRQRAVLQRGDQPELPRLGRDRLIGAGLLGTPQQLAGDRAGGLGIVQPPVAHVPALGAQLVREVPHRREQERDLLGMVVDIARLLHHLRHHHHVAVPVRLAQRRDLARELVAQHQHQPWPHHSMRAPALS